MRLIDADKLLEKEQVFFDEDGDYVDAVSEDDIEKAPTVDAVSVVRCKDCKWWNGSKNYDGSGLCMIEMNPQWVYIDDFCNYGEKPE